MDQKSNFVAANPHSASSMIKSDNILLYFFVIAITKVYRNTNKTGLFPFCSQENTLSLKQPIFLKHSQK